MQSTIIHIPHASLNIPQEYLCDYGNSDLHTAKIKMTDHFCDALFDCGRDMLIFPYSRLFCDVERFRDRKLEDMERCGMGAIYTRNYDGTILRKIDDVYREQLLSKFYDQHHVTFQEIVEAKLNEFGHCLIIDGHSFYPSSLPYENDKSERADFCIGMDEFHTPEKLVAAAVDFLEHFGYRVKINSPFAGSIVPLKFYGKDRMVTSIMLEINRKLYIDENACKTANFNTVKKLIANFIGNIEREFWNLQGANRIE